MKTINDLAAAIPGARIAGRGDTAVHGVAFDSRLVQPGDIFVAINGFTARGLHYIPEAIARGAVAVVCERCNVLWTVPTLYVPEVRSALAAIAACLYDFPSRKLGLIGVTGTDGKTTTTKMIASVLLAAGVPADFLSTVEQRTNGRTAANSGGYTTPDAVAIQRWIAETAAGDAGYAVLEVSSHALALSRVDHCDFDIAVCTNLTPEHLNFHGSITRYLIDKARLFQKLEHAPKQGIPRVAVVNGDDPFGEWFAHSAPSDVRVIRFGLGNHNDVSASAQGYGPDGTRFGLRTPRGEITIRTSTVGRHNVMNWLATAAVAEGINLPLEAIAQAAESFEGVRGRLQSVREGQPFQVYVDFAHTPAALSAALDAVQPAAGCRRLVIFGHAGGRDRKNRATMGEVAIRQADYAIITADDPGEEDPRAISVEIAAGADAAGGREGANYTIQVDRAAAIAHAFERAQPGDVVLIAGRGHEQTMPVGLARLPFDDVDVARTQLRGRLVPAKPAVPTPIVRGA